MHMLNCFLYYKMKLLKYDLPFLSYKVITRWQYTNIFKYLKYFKMLKFKTSYCKKKSQNILKDTNFYH